jgi:DNA-binding transcriptional LysR family regulator
MDLQQIEHFLAIAEEGSMTRAAARLHFAQSSLSSSIRCLEHELGVPLFTRGRTGMALTEAGKALLPAARRLRAEVDRAHEAVAAARGLAHGTVRVATIPATHGIDLCRIIESFRAAHPHVQVRIEYLAAVEMVTAVSQGDVDFAVTPRPATLPADVEFTPLFSSPLIVIAATDEPVQSRPPLRQDQICLDRVLDLPTSMAARHLFDRFLGDRRRRPRVEIGSWDEMVAMVARGVGIGYTPRALIDSESEGRVLQLIELVPSPQWQLGVAVRDDLPLGAAARILLTSVEATCRAT